MSICYTSLPLTIDTDSMTSLKSKPKKASAQRKRPKHSHDTPTVQAESRPEVLAIETLGEIIKAKVGYPLRDFQLRAIEAQLKRKDVVVHAGTGTGKTTIAAGPLFDPSTAGMLTLMVSPLIALQNEQVETFKKKFGLGAIALNSSNGGCSISVLRVSNSQLINTHDALRNTKARIVLVSPEVLLSKDFIDEVLRDKGFARRVLSVVVDEAHVVSHWGASFRKQYGELGMIRAFLPPKTPLVAMSATFPPRVRGDVLRRLDISLVDHISIDIGNDRSMVALAVRSIHGTIVSHTDFDFTVPNSATSPKDIPSTMLFSDSVMGSAPIIDHLEELLPENLKSTGLIRPFSAGLTNEYREILLRDFKAGVVRILVCTDAAGMGCDIPNVEVVVQWKLPDKLSTFIQRAGRAARAEGTKGLAVLLVERSAYGIDINNVGIKGAKALTKKEKKVYAARCGVERGAYGGKSDAISPEDQTEPRINTDADDEGLLAFVQTQKCRRRVVTAVFANTITEQAQLCCDICNPEILDRIRPGKPTKKTRQAAVKQGELSTEVQTKLRAWRTLIHERDHGLALFPSSGILSDGHITLLSSIPKLGSKVELEKLIAGKWGWWATYGDSLWEHLSALDSSVFSLKPLARKAADSAQAGEVLTLSIMTGTIEAEAMVVVEEQATLPSTSTSLPASMPSTSTSPNTTQQQPTISATPAQASQAAPVAAQTPAVQTATDYAAAYQQEYDRARYAHWYYNVYLPSVSR
ncbi:P-loop containing nucleoside triphosphate hydrolase protein [Ephemerocybe angulata]|uniref:DNA 3'-5' helicase n=1 Tax=Ephemerocybe angulata TaxID=980116 RepID=A0A8H6HAT6_9AGAR|nr:P-loop containing nucleoside triphosphate hydrolase protein [Tulosesus angulatus]